MAMFDRNEKKLESELDPSGVTSVRLAIGFCALGLVAALLLTPILKDGSQQLANIGTLDSEAGVDQTITGGVSKRSTAKRYTIRRSVLQSNPNIPCIIYEDGMQEGGC